MNATETALPSFKRLILWIARLFYFQSFLLGFFAWRYKDPGTAMGFAYAVASALIMSWGRRQLSGERISRAADALFACVLLADVVATVASPSHWAGGILPVLAASLVLPYFSGDALRRRLIAAFLFALAGVTLNPLIPHPTRTPSAFLDWYPVLTLCMASSLVLFALLIFHRSLSRDQKEREAAEVSAARASLRYRQVVEASGQGVWILDLEGRDVFVNERLLRMLGLNAGDERPPVLDLIGPSSRREILRSLYSGPGRAETMELSFRRPQGGLLQALLSLSTVRDAAGRISGAVGMLRDIGGQRALDEQLRQAERLEDVAGLAGALASDLEGQLGGLEEGLADLDSRLPAQGPAHEDLAAMKNAAGRAAGLLAQLKAFGRRQKLAPQELDLAPLIQGMRMTLERICGDGVQLSLDLPEGLGRVKADASQVEQVLLNLCSNAKDAMPQGGRLEIRLDLHELSEAEARAAALPWNGHCLRLRVKDDGTGIEANLLDRVFEPFFSTKGRGKGTGLGLATVYGIVRQSGGGLRLQSRPGLDTEVEVYLPLLQGAP